MSSWAFESASSLCICSMTAFFFVCISTEYKIALATTVRYMIIQRRGPWLDIPSEGLTPDGTLDGAEGELDDEPKPPKMPDITSSSDANEDDERSVFVSSFRASDKLTMTEELFTVASSKYPSC